MVYMGCPTGRVHIRRVKNNTVNLSVLIRKVTAINPVLQVCRKQLVPVLGNILPKNSLAIGYISHSAFSGHLKGNHILENPFVCTLMGREDQVVRGDSSRGFAFLLEGYFRLATNGCGCHRVGHCNVF
jgi:hypothetical protein